MGRRYNEPEYRRRIRQKAIDEDDDAKNDKRRREEGERVQEQIAAIRAIHDQQRAAQQEEPRQRLYDRLLHGLEIIALLVAAGVGIAAIRVSSHDARKQAELITESNRISRNTYVANARARIGPIKSSITGEIREGDSLKITTQFVNNGRDIAPTVQDGAAWLEPKSDWDKNATVPRLKDFADACLKKTLDADSTALQATFPTTPPANYTLTFDSGRGDTPFTINKALVDGDAVAVFELCWTYKTVEEIHHTAVCYFYDKSNTVPASLNYCPIGQEAD